jgi:hypothetical protein
VVIVDKLNVVEGMVDEMVVVYTVDCPDNVVVTVDKLTVVDGAVETTVVV